jgi:hypothetical protein
MAMSKVPPAAYLAAAMAAAVLWRVAHPAVSRTKQRKAEWLAEKAERKQDPAAAAAATASHSAAAAAVASSSAKKPPRGKQSQKGTKQAGDGTEKKRPAACPEELAAAAALVARARLPESARCATREAPTMSPLRTERITTTAAEMVPYLYVVGGRLRGRTLTTVSP